jgi:hypothetical protein
MLFYTLLRFVIFSICQSAMATNEYIGKNEIDKNIKSPGFKIIKSGRLLSL